MSPEPLRSTGPLAETRHAWLDCLEGEDRNSISNQFHQMLWDAASFRVVNEARRLSPFDESGKTKLSGLVHGLLNRTFFATQAAAIRRLTDAKNTGKKRSVLSLTGLITDIQDNTKLLTREAVFAAEGLEYEYAPIQKAQAQYEAEQVKAGESAWFTPPELVWEWNAKRHIQLDRLCGVEAETRTPGDSIPSEVLERLKTRIAGACGDVRQHVNKFIAHAATPESREYAAPSSIDLTLAHLWTGHSVLCQVASFLSVYILGSSSRGFLGHPLFDQFEYLEEPLVERAQINQLRVVWDEFEKETQVWANWGLDEFEGELGSISPLTGVDSEGEIGSGSARGMSER